MSFLPVQHHSTPLQKAAAGGHTGTCELLIRSGADVDTAIDRDQNTLLHRAAARGDTGTCELLISLGAGVMFQNEDQDTPLHKAAARGHTGTCELLIRSGADVMVKNKDQSTPLHKAAAASWHHTETCELLIRAGADVTVTDKEGKTPLDYARDLETLRHWKLAARGAKLLLLIPEINSYLTPKKRDFKADFKAVLKQIIPHAAEMVQGNASDLLCSEDEDPLIRNRTKLIRDLTSSSVMGDVLNHLLSRDILSDEEYERIRAKETPRDKARELLDIMHTKHKSARDVFKEVLREVNLHVAELLTCREDEDPLTMNRPELVQALRDVEPILDHLQACDTLTAKECDVIRAKQSPQDKARELLDMIGRKGAPASRKFKDAMDEVNPHAAEMIKDSSDLLFREDEDLGIEDVSGDPDVPIEVLLRGPEMARLYSQARDQGFLTVHSTRVPVVGQFRSGKSCFIKRLMGETVRKDEEEPITDGIHIISDVQTKTWKKSPEEIDELAGPLLPTETSTGQEMGLEEQTMPDSPSLDNQGQPQPDSPSQEHQGQPQPDSPSQEHQGQPQPDSPSHEHQGQPPPDSPSQEHQGQPQPDSPSQEHQGQPLSDSPSQEHQGQPQSDSPSQEHQGQPLSDSPSQEHQGQPEPDSPSHEHQGQPQPDSPSQEHQGQPQPDSPSQEHQGQPLSDSPSQEHQGQPQPDSPSQEHQGQPLSDSPSQELQGQPQPDSPSQEHQGQPLSDSPSQELQGQPQPDSPSHEHQGQPLSDSPSQQQTNIKDDLSKVMPEKQKTDVIPDNLLESGERMLKAGITQEELGTATNPRLSFWDFGGQATYYGTHHCFITPQGVYILVMSLLQKLSDPVPDQDYMASVDNLRTGGDYLDHWLNSVHSHTQQHKKQPPVIIVLTHKDMVSKEYIDKYKEEIRSHIKRKAAGKLVMSKIFAVDNTTEDAAVDKIRDYIRQVARELPHMGEEIPISWLHLNSRLKTKRKEADPFCTFQEVVELARDPDISITDRHTLAMVLTFFHDRGDIIFFDEPSLRDDVTLQPQVMIDAFKTIITVPPYQHGRKTKPRNKWMSWLLSKILKKKKQQRGPDLSKMWERLEQEGVLSDELLTRIWEKKDEELEKPFLLRYKSFLKALMEKFYLICNATPVGDASEEAQQNEIYFVPALLSCKRDNAKLYPRKMHVCPQPLYFVFSEKFLPSGMFCRLQALCVRRFGLKESYVFAGCARFPTDVQQETFVITKVNHYLKVELLSSSKVFTEGLRVRKFLSSALFEIKEKWIPCIQYKLKFCSTLPEEGSEPAFQTLPTGDGPVEQDSGVPSEFRKVWMTGISQAHRTENSGGDGPVILQPTGDPSNMRTIGPVLDTMELGRGLSLDQCDSTRSQLTPKDRVNNLVRLVENRCLLGAAVEMCCPEFADCFLREERGKEVVILHTDDYMEEFISPLQTAASESGLSCHTEIIQPTDSITEKTVKLLLNTNNRMVLLVITPQTLHHEHWSNLDYEFPVRNGKLLLPILLYPRGSRDRMVRVLQQRAPVLCSLVREEIEMDGTAVSQERMHEILNKVMTDEEKDFQQMLGSIFDQLDETDVRLLQRVWSARIGQQEIAGTETPHDVMRAKVKSGYISTGDLGMPQLEKDMMAAGISLPALVRDIPGIPNELHYVKTTKAFVGPTGGEMEISGFAKLVVPPGILQQDTAVSISIADIPGILRGEEGFSWLSDYPWSLGEDAYPRELLDHVLFSPAVDVNLHGAQPDGPMELQTWRPPGSEGMQCVLLKHFDGEGWADITASTTHQIYSDKLSISMHTFCPLCVVWTTLVDVGKLMTSVLSSRTLDCRFSAYIKSHEEDVDFHVVCRDKAVEKEEYRPGFEVCGSNKAMFDLYHRNDIEVAVSVQNGQKESKTIELRAQLCCEEDGQNVQMFLDRPSGKHLKGDVIIKSAHERPPRTVCEFKFREEGRVSNRDSKRTDGHHPDTSKPQARSGGVQTESSAQEGARETGGAQPADSATQPPRGPAGAEGPASQKEEGFKAPVVLFVNDEYGTSKGGISTINSQMVQTLTATNAVVYNTALRVPKRDQETADRDGVQLIQPVQQDEESVPTLDWLTKYHSVHFPNLPQDVTCIIGHADITDTAARNIWDQRYPHADLVTITHVIPEDTEYYKGGRKAMKAWEKEKDMLDKINNVKAAFSVGKRIFEHCDNMYRGEKKPQSHYIFLPKPSEMFLATTVRPGGQQKVVLSIGRVRKVEKLKGHDLIAQSMGEVAKEVRNVRLRVRGISEDDFETSKKILEDNLKSGKLNPTLLPYGTQEDILEDMMTAHLVLMPSRCEPFGLVGLEAIAAGIPVLISDKTGLADLILDLIEQGKLHPDHKRVIVETNVNDTDPEGDVRRWASKIVDILKYSDSEFEKAARFKQELVESKYWEESHCNFLQACGIPAEQQQKLLLAIGRVRKVEKRKGPDLAAQTCLADMISDLIQPEHRHVIVKTTVNDSDIAGDAKRWASKTIDILKYSNSEFEKAAKFKLELVESSFWEETRRNFLQACGIPALTSADL
ncbi:uncharacterized protein LOC118416323 [Branchiostoma floridae]|uniref:Uncharacterized protein LOC118416323 n=1 Tax=Branchiostoma floridae TaxID=7739 RepID=A0A9J7L7B8_BRAFL|nr:uncharacterized protein LOC118416323 [Branchiostoma floridae]